MQPAGPVQNPQFAQPSKVCVAHFCLHAVHTASACCLPVRRPWQGAREALGAAWQLGAPGALPSRGRALSTCCVASAGATAMVVGLPTSSTEPARAWASRPAARAHTSGCTQTPANVALSRFRSSTFATWCLA